MLLGGELGGLACLLDHEVVRVSLDDMRDVAVLVPRKHEKPPRVLPHGLVLAARDLEQFAAVLPRALADEANQERVVAVEAGQPRLELDDSLVDLAEERLVSGPPSLVFAHLRRFPRPARL